MTYKEAVVSKDETYYPIKYKMTTTRHALASTFDFDVKVESETLSELSKGDFSFHINGAGYSTVTWNLGQEIDDIRVLISGTILTLEKQAICQERDFHKQP